jgi:hypothetical protein
MFQKNFQLCKKVIDKQRNDDIILSFLQQIKIMRNLFITLFTSVALLNSCIVPNGYVANDTGFEVDTETTALIIASGLLEKDASYEDELVRISDMLANMSFDSVVTVEELRKACQDAIMEFSSPKRRTKVLVAFEVLFGYYANVAGKEGYLTADSAAAIDGIARGIGRAIEYHWLVESGK